MINPINAELNPIRHLLALVGAHHILHVSRVRVKNPTIAEAIRLNRLRWFGHVQRMEGSRIPLKSSKYEFANNKAER